VPYGDPAPAGTASLDGTFGGTFVSGVWNLYVIDDADNDSGEISGGWCLLVGNAIFVNGFE
jgi:hypothetical protein